VAFLLQRPVLVVLDVIIRLQLLCLLLLLMNVEQVGFLKKSRGVMRTVLVTGGAGYIGSHIVEQLATRGDRVIILDALIYGQPWPRLAQPMQAQPMQSLPIQAQPMLAKPVTSPYAQELSFYPFFTQEIIAKDSPVQAVSTHAVPVIPGDVFCVQGQCGDATLLDSLFSQFSIDAVIHCAALIEVGVSVKEPLSFYATNVAQTLTLLDRMKAHTISTLIFSSSAAVYGNPGVDLISEAAPCCPLNPYGQSKLFIEHVLADSAQAYGLRYAALRYFNVAGAYPEKHLGERHQPETHVAPLLLRAAVAGTPFNLYSADYGTVDGTCIRDYVHVRDIARANVLALDALCPQSLQMLNTGALCSGALCSGALCSGALCSGALCSRAPSLKDASVAAEIKKIPCSAEGSEICCTNLAVSSAHQDSFTLNIGSGAGVSVLDLVHEVERVTGKSIATRIVERRSGDAASLVADATRAKKLLNWHPQFTLQEMLRDAYLFHFQAVHGEGSALQPSSLVLER